MSKNQFDLTSAAGRFAFEMEMQTRGCHAAKVTINGLVQLDFGEGRMITLLPGVVQDFIKAAQQAVDIAVPIYQRWLETGQTATREDLPNAEA